MHHSTSYIILDVAINRTVLCLRYSIINIIHVLHLRHPSLVLSEVGKSTIQTPHTAGAQRACVKVALALFACSVGVAVLLCYLARQTDGAAEALTGSGMTPRIYGYRSAFVHAERALSRERKGHSQARQSPHTLTHALLVMLARYALSQMPCTH